MCCMCMSWVPMQAGTTIPWWQYRFPSAQRSQASSGPVSTTVGDHVGIPGVVLLLLLFLFVTPLIPRYGYPRDAYGLFFLSVWSHNAHSKYQYPPPVITNYIRRCTLHIPVVHQQLHITITMFPLLLAFDWKSEPPWEVVLVVPEELEPHVLVSEVEAHRTNNSCALHSSQSSYLSHLFNKVMMMLGYDHYLYTLQQRLQSYLLHFGKCTILNYYIYHTYYVHWCPAYSHRYHILTLIFIGLSIIYTTG